MGRPEWAAPTPVCIPCILVRIIWHYHIICIIILPHITPFILIILSAQHNTHPLHPQPWNQRSDPGGKWELDCGVGLELQTKVREIFIITDKAPTRAFSWLKVHTGTLRIKANETTCPWCDDFCIGVPTSYFHESTPVQHSVLNVKALVGASNQEKALVGGFFVIVNSSQTFVWNSNWNGIEWWISWIHFLISEVSRIWDIRNCLVIEGNEKKGRRVSRFPAFILTRNVTAS